MQADIQILWAGGLVVELAKLVISARHQRRETLGHQAG